LWLGFNYTWLGVNSVEFGLNDNLSVGGGFEAFSTLMGHPLVFASVKASTPIGNKVYVGGKVLVGASFELGRRGDWEGFVVPLATLTVGNTDHNFSLNAAFATDWQGYAGGAFLISLAGTTRLSNRLSLVSENWGNPTGGAFLIIPSLGARIMGQDLALNLGLFSVLNWEANEVEVWLEDYPCMPYLGGAVTF
jgi:hypothetical protein